MRPCEVLDRINTSVYTHSVVFTKQVALVVKLVYTPVLETGALQLAGSSPAEGKAQ